MGELKEEGKGWFVSLGELVYFVMLFVFRILEFVLVFFLVYFKSVEVDLDWLWFIWIKKCFFCYDGDVDGR